MYINKGGIDMTQQMALLNDWPPHGFRCPFCGEIHAFPRSMWFPWKYSRSIDLFCGNQKLQLWAEDYKGALLWKVHYPAYVTEKSLEEFGVQAQFGKEHWTTWKVPEFLSNEIWIIGKLGHSLPINGTKYLPNHIIIFGLVFDDEAMERICSANPPIITAAEVERYFMSNNRFETRHTKGVIRYCDGGKEKEIVFKPRSYFRSTPFMDNFVQTKQKLGIIPEDVWERDASVHYTKSTA